ncbi:sensor domain-containing diguanylate cyclase [Rhodoferax sp. UBA5149]|uniref:sensor domain-containing diguanylate cyclase n=1 Tax=Rhodoferax sp. UBA5149 TaxID=1947379 RepID=UPI0025EFBA44|nr:sensor domain-containing diguanylate cyclase [Rhodoferax sp. UBA5149]
MGEAELNRERLELALEAAGLDLWENNLLTGEVTRKAMKTLTELGYSEHEMVVYVDDIYKLFHPDDVMTVKTAVDDHLSGRTPQYRCEFRLRAKNGVWVWYANYGKVMDGHSDAPGKRFIGVTFNIDDRKRKEDEIAQINRQLADQNTLLQSCNAALELLAASDSLTGLANRRTLMELGGNECKRAERFSHPVSLLMVDIDLFKSVNDAWGHLVGDHVICAVADACRTRIRGGLDTVARVGGEEFVIVLPETDHPSARILAESLCQAVAAQQVAANDEGVSVTFTVSIGVATVEGGNLSFEQLMNNADKALYKAKQAGRNNVQSFDGTGWAV